MMRSTLTTLLLVSAMAASAGAQAFVIDGNLGDWGVNRHTGAFGWIPSPGIHYTIEDQHASYLNPGYGGQAYDAEAIYTTIAKDSDNKWKLFIALATGHNPNTVHNPGANSYGAGDFAIDFGQDGTFELGINIRHAVPGGKESFGVEGGVYANAQWAYGLWNAAGAYDPAHPDAAHPTHLLGGTYLGLADLAYTTTGQNGYGAWADDVHYFYELSIGLDLLTQAGWDGRAFNIHWTENCANDSILVASPQVQVPEPATLALLPLGLVGIAFLRRRQSA
jgi:hypothetical protein